MVRQLGQTTLGIVRDTGDFTLFCGRVDATQAGGIFGLDAEHEDIEVVVLSLADALAKVASGEINNAMSIIALQWLQINQPLLEDSWNCFKIMRKDFRLSFENWIEKFRFCVEIWGKHFNTCTWI